METKNIILFGTGATGRFILRDMQAIGTQPLAFADNDPKRQGKEINGIKVLSPDDCKKAYPDAEWIAAVMHTEYMPQILEQIASMGVKTSPLWHFVPNRDKEIPDSAFVQITEIAGDVETVNVLVDQRNFRRHPDYIHQLPHRQLEEVYFPEFYTHLADEHLVDCGAADGDTIKEFIARWPNWSLITAIEPDKTNYVKLRNNYGDNSYISLHCNAVSDFNGRVKFESTADHSSRIGGDGPTVYVHKLDDANLRIPPTLIKMDIEGAEVEALWGARRILKEHKPVLAICAYHLADHLWQIPLLIHAIQPEYKLFLRRYRPGTWETIWYAVPPKRIVK